MLAAALMAGCTCIARPSGPIWCTALHWVATLVCQSGSLEVCAALVCLVCVPWSSVCSAGFLGSSWLLDLAQSSWHLGQFWSSSATLGHSRCNCSSGTLATASATQGLLLLWVVLVSSCPLSLSATLGLLCCMVPLHPHLAAWLLPASLPGCMESSSC